MIIPDALIVRPDTTVREAIAQMSRARSTCDFPQTVNGELEKIYRKARSSCVLVVEDQQLLGIFSERDLLRLIAQQSAWDHLLMREVMTFPVVTLQESAFTDLSLAIDLLQQHHIHSLPILNAQNQVIGLVTRESLDQGVVGLELDKTTALVAKVVQLEAEKSELREAHTIELEQVLEKQVVANAIRSAAIDQANLWEHKQAEIALIHGEVQSRAILAALPDFMFCVNADGIYRQFAIGNRAINFLPADFEVVGLAMADILPAEIATRHLYHLEKALRTEELQVYEQQIQLDGQLRYEEIRVVKSGENEALFIVRDISSRKQAEQQLYQLNQSLEDKVQIRTAQLQRREAELQKLSERLALSLKSGAIGCWEWNIVQNILLWDERMYELYGIPKQINVHENNETWVNTLHADDRLSTETLLEQAILGQKEFDTEFQIVHPDGSIHFIKSHGVVVRDAQGNPQSMTGINFDISDRKQVELKLQQKAKQERLLISITHRMRSSLNLKNILSGTVEEVQQVLKADRVLVYQVFPDGTGAAIAESVLPSIPQILDIVFSKEVFPEENYDRYIQGRVYALSDREDPNQFILPCLIEFLTKIQVRAKLVVPIIQNQTLWGLLIAHQCDRPRHWQEWEINLLRQTANQLAIAIHQANLFEQLQQQLIERQQAETQLTKTNQQLAISNEELARATRLKDEFLANMSHELRTPLNAILGMTEGLEDEVFGSVNQQQIKALKTIERSGSHLLELINDILDVAKIESGQLELEYSSVDVAQLCQSSMAFIKQQALKKGIQFETKLQQHLPNLLVDERRIRQVLINLLNNAVKFTPENGHISLEVTQLPPDIALVDESPQNFLRIAIIDTGIGISSENIQKLFQPFIQIDSALNRQYNGTGLGLALVKRIVELHGGRVSLTSELGVGSCFSIELPCIYNTSQPSLVSSNELVTTKVSGASPDTKQSPLILLAEDNEANISTFSGYLGAKGYRIVVAKNGQEAIDLAQAHQPELILIDIQMLGMDGLETIKQIRLESKLISTPIIALTALAMTADQIKCLEAGANAYLAKPVKLQQLTTTIQRLLAGEGE